MDALEEEAPRVGPLGTPGAKDPGPDLQLEKALEVLRTLTGRKAA